jgi:hypothetical protein
MADDAFTYKPQDVHYLGFLEAQLRDMQGIDALAYELIQNADDVTGDEDGRFPATHLTFNITDEALIVRNDGVFRDVDFLRLQNVAGGGKRDEAETTGAFGLGFIAVYQVTDRPEILSHGRHWTIHPEAEAAQRILERQTPTEGTCFHLPWAFNEQSIVRRTLRLAAIRPDELDNFAAHIATAMTTAALFLRRLRLLEVQRNGRLLRRIERILTSDGRLQLHDDAGQVAEWKLLHGDFAAAADPLRGQYPWQIEATRHSQVRLALPLGDTPQTPGRFFAGLPTQSTMPLPLYVNADFYPTTDRKRIHFGAGYQGEWNEAAITCAARILADYLPQLPTQLGHRVLWRLLHQTAVTHQQATSGDLPAVLAAFWQTATPTLADLPLVYTVQGNWIRPSAARLGHKLTPASTDLLTNLAVALVHPDLAAYDALLRRPEIGVPDLAVRDIAAALADLGLTRATPLYAAPPCLRQLADWQTLWALLDNLLSHPAHPADREAARQSLRPFALALTRDMILERLDAVYHGRSEAQELFPHLPWLHPALSPDAFPGRFVPPFGARQAVTLLADQSAESLTDDWRMGRLDIPALLRWLEAQSIEIFSDDPTLPAHIRRLPLCPVDGELRPLRDLYLPGGFTDPLKLAGLVDLAAIGGRRQFLQDLGVGELDFATYVHDVMPRVLAANPDAASDARHELVRLLAQRLGEFRDDEELQERLSGLPLVACLDGSFRAATAVYADRAVIALLGEQIHVAEPVESKAVRALHRWLGVRQQPEPADLVAALIAIGRQPDAAHKPLDAATLQRVLALWQPLAELPPDAATTVEMLRPLQNQPVIPNNQGVLTAPARLFLADRPELAARFRALPDPAAQAGVVALSAKMAGITAVIGLRPLSQAATLVVDTGGPAAPDAALRDHIRQRRPLISRLLYAEAKAEATAEAKAEATAEVTAEATAEAPAEANWLDKLQVIRAAWVQVHYHLALGPAEALSTAPEEVTAKWVGETAVLYVTYAGNAVPWTAVARELAQALKPGRAIGLALGLKEILAAPTFAAAAQILTELGYN